MVVAAHARVAAQIMLVLCFAAGMVASCIIFVLYGPVPVRRKVTIVPRLSPPDVFAMPAVKVVSLPALHELAQQVEPGIAFRTLPHAPTPHAAPAPQAPPKKPEPLVTPLVLRRPRGDSPPPLPRNRSARGTERRPRPSELEITAVRAIDTSAYHNHDQDNTAEHTLEAPRYSYDDDAFLEDGR